MIQHEVDHLDGVLMLDRTEKDQRKGALRALREGGTYAPEREPEDEGEERPEGESRPDVQGVRTAYLGTSEFAATVLRRLAESPHSPALVVTPPDSRSGRGRRLSPPPAAEAARELGLELHQTADVNSDGISDRDPSGQARGDRRLRLRPADQGAAAERVPDAERPPVADPALARRRADRAHADGRATTRPASRSCG